jgi:hypothetical protein
MESDGRTVLLGILIGGAILVLLGPPFLMLAYHKIRHRRGRWFRRSARRSHH